MDPGLIGLDRDDDMASQRAIPGPSDAINEYYWDILVRSNFAIEKDGIYQRRVAHSRAARTLTLYGVDDASLMPAAKC
jgi:hypothetical protein